MRCRRPGYLYWSGDEQIWQVGSQDARPLRPLERDQAHDHQRRGQRPLVLLCRRGPERRRPNLPRPASTRVSRRAQRARTASRPIYTSTRSGPRRKRVSAKARSFSLPLVLWSSRQESFCSGGSLPRGGHSGYSSCRRPHQRRSTSTISTEGLEGRLPPRAAPALRAPERRARGQSLTQSKRATARMPCSFPRGGATTFHPMVAYITITRRQVRASGRARPWPSPRR